MISRIHIDETMHIRSISLRWGRPYDQCRSDADDHPEVFHLGYKDEGKVVGTATFYPASLEGYEGLGYRLRMMGVLSEYRGKGVGRAIMEEGLRIIKNEIHANYIWFNARRFAYDFYHSLGYDFVSEEFDIIGIGPHKVMYMEL